jgi:hypothetical protein
METSQLIQTSDSNPWSLCLRGKHVMPQRLILGALLFSSLAGNLAWTQTTACLNTCNAQCKKTSHSPGEYRDCMDYCEQTNPACQQQVPTTKVTLYPKYQILTLVYAPPGCTGCTTPGQVEYQHGSSAGTKVSADRSFKDAKQISVDLTLGDPDVASFSVGGSNGWSRSATDSSSVTISKGDDQKMDNSNATDGVDHNKDVFWLLLNPAVVVRGQGGQHWWNMGYKGKGANLAQIAVSELKNCSSGKTPRSPFDKFTASDCNMILKQDPFANNPTFDPDSSNRFVQNPVRHYSYLSSGSCLIITDTETHERDTDNSHKAESEYTVGYSVGVTGGGGDIVKVKASAKITDDWTWTNSSSVSATTGSTQSAFFTLPCPTRDTGKPWIVVYWDSLYASFMFMPRLDSEMGLVIHQGHVSNAAGKLVPQQLVELSYGGKTYHTSTDRDGNYKFFAPKNTPGGAQPATGQLSVRGVRQVVTLRTSTVNQVRVQ